MTRSLINVCCFPVEFVSAGAKRRICRVLHFDTAAAARVIRPCLVIQGGCGPYEA